MYPFDATFQVPSQAAVPVGPYSSLKGGFAGDFVLPTSSANEDNSPIPQQQLQPLNQQTSSSSTSLGVTQLHGATYLNFQRPSGETETGLFRGDGSVIFGGYTVPSNGVPNPWHATLAVNPAPQPNAKFPYINSFVGLAWGYPGNFTTSYAGDQLQVTLTWAEMPLTSGSVILNNVEQMANVYGFYTHFGWFLTFFRNVGGLSQTWIMSFDQDGKGFRGQFTMACCGYQGVIFPLEGTVQPSQ